jgi:hypothetical protein
MDRTRFSSHSILKDVYLEYIKIKNLKKIVPQGVPFLLCWFQSNFHHRHLKTEVLNGKLWTNLKNLCLCTQNFRHVTMNRHNSKGKCQTTWTKRSDQDQKEILTKLPSGPYCPIHVADHSNFLLPQYPNMHIADHLQNKPFYAVRMTDFPPNLSYQFSLQAISDFLAFWINHGCTLVIPP